MSLFVHFSKTKQMPFLVILEQDLVSLKLRVTQLNSSKVDRSKELFKEQAITRYPSFPMQFWQDAHIVYSLNISYCIVFGNWVGPLKRDLAT